MPPILAANITENKKTAITCVCIAISSIIPLMWQLDQPNMLIDETVYIYLGIRYIRFLYWGEFNPDRWAYEYDHPPLAKYLVGVSYHVLSSGKFGIRLPLLFAVRLPIVLLGSLTSVFVYLLGRDMYNTHVGVIAALLLSFEPVFLAWNRCAYLDGPLTFFYVVTIWSFYRGINKCSKPYIIVSGLSFGLALSTKLTAFLIPLIIFGWLFLQYFRKFKSFLIDDVPFTLPLFSRIILLWIPLGFIVFFGLWPWLWKDPLYHLLLTLLYNSVHLRTGDLTFFMGQTYWYQPWYFYFVIIFARFSPQLFIAFLVSLIVYFWKVVHNTIRLSEYLLGLWIAIPLIYMSTLSVKLGIRFILMIVPPIMILISATLFDLIHYSTRVLLKRNYIANILGKGSPVNYFYVMGGGFIISLILLSAAYSPYYNLYYSPFVGGPNEVIANFQVGAGEGLQTAAEYINSKTENNSIVVCAGYSKVFREYCIRKTLDIQEITTIEDLRENKVEYVVFYINWIQRYALDNDIWQYFEATSPEYIVVIKDIPLVWIYRTPY